MCKFVKILNILTNGSGEFGGIENYLYNNYKMMDRKRIKYDFAFCGKNTMKAVMTDSIFSDSKFYELNRIDEKKKKTIVSIFMLIHELSKIIKLGSYSIIHVHAGSFVVQLCSMLADIKHKVNIHIAHSHSRDVPIGNKKNVSYSKIKRFLSWAIVENYDLLCACSIQAGISLFGEECINNPKFMLLRNAIDLKLFGYDEKIRICIRKHENIKDGTFIVAIVGRLVKIKNYAFAIEIFYEFEKKHPNSFLWIIGDGEEKVNLLKLITNLGLSEKVKFWGYVNNVHEIMQAIDLLLVTSISEGFSLNVMEAQASGLPVICSTGVPDTCSVSNLVCFAKLSDSPVEWANKGYELISNNKSRYGREADLAEKGFNLCVEAQKLEDLYLKLSKNNNDFQNRNHW